jgi:hypothetical protein
VFQFAAISCIISQIEVGYALLSPLVGRGNQYILAALYVCGCRRALLVVLWEEVWPREEQEQFPIAAGLRNWQNDTWSDGSQEGSSVCRFITTTNFVSAIRM